ncbi:MAG: transposase [Pirellulaceae bacterium]|nr:transposase [Pirellulaceae bacterium]
MDQQDISYFDPDSEWSIVERGLPHWTQAGCVVFITWRLDDSLPAEVLQQLDAEIKDVLLSERLDPSANWKLQLASRDPRVRGKVQRKLFAIRDKYLDCGYGACHLANPVDANTVLNSLRKFDGDRYFLSDAVVMPNHAHFLCDFASETEMLKQCTEWKRYSGRQINQRHSLLGEFWQVDQFDHLIRSPEQFEHYRRYIAENPSRAKLQEGTFLHFHKQLTT